MFRIACNVGVSLLCALMIVLVGMLFAWSGKPIAAADDGGPMTTTCTEDMPCWDCSTMGNHICGVLP